MSSTRGSSPSWDDEEDYAAAADEHHSPQRRQQPPPPSSPGSIVGGRRTRSQFEDDDDEAGLTPNEMATLERYARHKKLRKEEWEEVQRYTNYSPALQRALDRVDSTVQGRQIDEQAAKSQAAKFEIPGAFKTNAKALGYKLLVKPSASVYKGKVITSELLEQLIDLGCGLPANVRNDQAIMDLLFAWCGAELSNCRSTLRKMLHKSYGIDEKATAPNVDPTQHATLLDLTKAVVGYAKGVKVTYEHCARVAVMRKVYTKAPKEGKPKDFWADVQSEVERMAKGAQESAERAVQPRKPTKAEVAAKLSNIYKGIVKKDREHHGDSTLEKDGIDDLASGRADDSAAMMGSAAAESSSEAGAGQAASPRGDED